MPGLLAGAVHEAPYPLADETLGILQSVSFLPVSNRAWTDKRTRIYQAAARIVFWLLSAEGEGTGCTFFLLLSLWACFPA